MSAKNYMLVVVDSKGETKVIPDPSVDNFRYSKKEALRVSSLHLQVLKAKQALVVEVVEEPK